MVPDGSLLGLLVVLILILGVSRMALGRKATAETTIPLTTSAPGSGAATPLASARMAPGSEPGDHCKAP